MTKTTLESQLTNLLAGHPHGPRILPHLSNLEFILDRGGNHLWRQRRTPSLSQVNCDSSYCQNCDRIGTTGYDYVNQQSISFGFDIDGDKGHANGLTPERLEAAKALWLQVSEAGLHYSTGGQGLHVHITLATPVPCASRRDHAAHAKHVLAELELRVPGIAATTDAVGGNIWVWCSNPTATSFQLIKQAEHDYEYKGPVTPPAAEQPTPSPKANRPFDGLLDVKLDNEHEAILDAYSKHGGTYTLPQGDAPGTIHTGVLNHVANEMKAAGMLRGDYQSISQATDPKQPNGYFHLRANGVLYVARFGTANEHESWTVNAAGHAQTYFNSGPAIDLQTIGSLSTKGGRVCEPLELASALEQRGLAPTVPTTTNPITVKSDRRNLILSTPAKGVEVPEGWHVEGRSLVRVIEDYVPAPIVDAERPPVRVVQVEDNLAYEVLCGAEGYTELPHGHAAKYLARDFTDIEVTSLMADALDDRYRGVYVPFGPADLGRRKVNTARNCWIVDAIEGPTPHFDALCRHIGTGLNDAIAGDRYCQENGIVCGGDYLLTWFALAIQLPAQGLPYLGLYSPRQDDSGKSTFANCPQLLVSPSLLAHYGKAGALANQFTGSLDKAVFCHVEEVPLNTPQAIDAMKNYVTSELVGTERKGQDERLTTNYTHWLQTTNNPDYFPISNGDARCVIWEVPSIAKKLPNMRQLLAAEAPAIRHKLENLPLPPMEGRAYLPVLSTELKDQQLQKAKRLSVPAWLVELAEDGFVDLARADVWKLASRIDRTVTPQRVTATLANETVRSDLRALGYAVTTGDGSDSKNRLQTTYTLSHFDSTPLI